MLFTNRITLKHVTDAIKMTREKVPGRELILLHDGAPLVGGVRAIDCRVESIESFSKLDLSGIVFVYLCSEHFNGAPFIQDLIKRGGRYIPAWTFGPALYVDTNPIARRVLEDEWEMQNREGFAKWDAGAGDFINLCQALEITRKLSGAFLELGCFRGSSGSVVMHYMRDAGIHRDAYFFDVFDGFAYESAVKSADAVWAGTHGTEGREAIEARLKRYEQVEKGLKAIVMRHNIVEEEIPVELSQIAVANIDVDLYEAVAAGLAKVAPRMVPGGIMVVEDPGHTPALVGARVALDEFLATNQAADFTPIYLESGQTFLVRTRGGELVPRRGDR